MVHVKNYMPVQCVWYTICVSCYVFVTVSVAVLSNAYKCMLRTCMLAFVCHSGYVIYVCINVCAYGFVISIHNEATCSGFYVYVYMYYYYPFIIGVAREKSCCLHT